MKDLVTALYIFLFISCLPDYTSHCRNGCLYYY